jgi:hypothetical protein
LGRQICIYHKFLGKYIEECFQQDSATDHKHGKL